MTEKQMEDWRAICEAFANKFGYTLLFVNEESCGVELQMEVLSIYTQKKWQNF